MNSFCWELERLKKEGLYRKPKIIQKSKGPYVIVDGVEFLNFSSNDYLGLAQHPELKNFGKLAEDLEGFGSGSSRLLCGTTQWHVKLESALARLKKTQAALLFPTGYMANLGLISSIANKDTLILSDSLNHASIIDGCMLSKARTLIYPHADSSFVEESLYKLNGYRRKIIITESIFSMEGDLAPLERLHQISRRFGAILVVDDAHATGILGKMGSGALEYLGLKTEGVIILGTLSKALGNLGGFACADKDLIELLKNRAKTFIYTTAPPALLCKVALRAIELIEEEKWRREKLLENISYFKTGLSELGFKTNKLPIPIVPLMLGDLRKTLRFSSVLWEEKILAPPIRPPTVPEGSSRIRISLSCLHEKAHLDILLKTIKKANNIASDGK